MLRRSAPTCLSRWGPRTAEAVRIERERPLTAGEKTGAELSLQRLWRMNVPGLENQLVEIERMLVRTPFRCS